MSRSKQQAETVGRLKRLLASFESRDLNPVDCLVLEHLRATGGASQTMIGRMLHGASSPLTPSNISRHISRLVSKGYVKRGPGSDNRTKRVVATLKGKNAAKAYDALLRSTFPVEELVSAALVIECPSCRTSLRLRRFFSQGHVTCPECRQKFGLHFEKHECVLKPSNVVVRDDLPQQDPHTVLGVQRGATSAEVSDARRTALRKYHPDLFHHLGVDFVTLATRRSQAINHAFDRLNGKR